MAKQKKKKLSDKSHWLSFRDDLVPFANECMFDPFGVPFDYEKLRDYFASGYTGFGDFLSTKIGKFIYSGALPNFSAVANETYSTTLWDACGRIVLKPSEGLLRLLMETDAKIPIRDVNPPFTSVFIELPKDLIQIPDASSPEEIISASGLYVSWGDIGATGDHTAHVMTAGGKAFNDCSHHVRVLLIGPGAKSISPVHNWSLRYQTVCWEPDCPDSVDAIVKRNLDILEADSGDKKVMKDPFSFWSRMPVDECIMRIAANLFLYMSCPDADIINNPSELHTRLADMKKRKISSTRRRRVRRQIDEGMVPSLTVNVGSSIVIRPGMYTESDDSYSEGGRKSPKPHWRRGHFRHVRYGEKSMFKRIQWIKPVLVRKDAGGETEIKPYEVHQ